MNAPLRVLVVDDDPDIRLLLKELLERAGYAVDEAADGKTGLRKLFANTPSLVILDVTMPELDGYQTLERIRDLSDVPVLMLTARSQELEKVRGLSAGADDYVAKPFGRQELLARVQALLRRTGGKSEVIEAYSDDFTQVDYINSTGIALIVRLLAEARRDHRAVIAEGLSDLEAVRWGCAAGAHMVEHPGVVPGLPTRAQLEARLGSVTV